MSVPHNVNTLEFVKKPRQIFNVRTTPVSRDFGDLPLTIESDNV